MVKRFLLGAVILALIGSGVLFWKGGRLDHTPRALSDEALNDPAWIERGAYLARLGNCSSCHSTPGKAPFAGGEPMATTFGVFFGPNITPDPEAGIGAWSADDFWQALNNGKGKEGQWLYPAFPYTSYARLSREDVDALFAYLRTVPADATPNVPHALNFPFNQRWLLRGWRALYFNPVGYRLEGEVGAEQLGKHLVDGLTHCVECHTPRNRLGALDPRRNLQGATMPTGWYAPPLTGDRTVGLGNWTEEDIVVLLKTGVNRHSHVAGPMAEVVLGGMQYAQEGDLYAIARYLKSLPSAGLDAARTGPAAETALLEQGRQIYTQQCASCHGDAGQGDPPAWPSLAGNISVVAPDPHNTIRLVLQGGYAPATSGNPQPHGMPPFGPFLNDQDIAAVVTYVRQSWGNRAGSVSLPMVRRVREQAR